MLATAARFGIGADVYSNGPPQDIAPSPAAPRTAICFNGMISKKAPDEPDDAAYQHAGPSFPSSRRRNRQALGGAPAAAGEPRACSRTLRGRIEALKRARLGRASAFVMGPRPREIPMFGWTHTYQDVGEIPHERPPNQYLPLRKMIELFPEPDLIGRRTNGRFIRTTPESFRAFLLNIPPQLHFDTIATKCRCRRGFAPTAMPVRFALSVIRNRFLFGSASWFTGHMHVREH